MNTETQTEKKFYTTQELVSEPDFPIRSIHTVKKLVDMGVLKAINISTNPKFKRFRIAKESVEDFLKNHQTGLQEIVKKIQPKKKTKKKVTK